MNVQVVLWDMDTPSYLNVDLEVRSQADLTPLVAAFGERVTVLYHGPGDDGAKVLASFELTANTRTAATTIARFCALIESLDGPASALWEGAESRVFDIGFDSGAGRKPATAALPPATLLRVAKLKGSIAITVHPQPSDDTRARTDKAGAP